MHYPTQEACIEHLEAIRWGDVPVCPLCNSDQVARKRENKLVGRWNCHECKSSFNVLSGTVLEKTKIPLQKWFLAFALLINAKKSISSHQLARDLDLTQPTAWYLAHRIRTAMAQDRTEDDLLQGIVEADETFIGGKPRKANRKADRVKHSGGRGGKKVTVLGAVERGGRVKTQVTGYVRGWDILRFLKRSIDPRRTELLTDEYRGYNSMSSIVPHYVINHSQQYADGDVHTNTIEGFWALVKRAWYGTHHHYTTRYMPLYMAESSWKYNARKNPLAFETLLRGLFG